MNLGHTEEVEEDRHRGRRRRVRPLSAVLAALFTVLTSVVTLTGVSVKDLVTWWQDRPVPWWERVDVEQYPVGPTEVGLALGLRYAGATEPRQSLLLHRATRAEVSLRFENVGDDVLDNPVISMVVPEGVELVRDSAMLYNNNTGPAGRSIGNALTSGGTILSHEYREGASGHIIAELDFSNVAQQCGRTTYPLSASVSARSDGISPRSSSQVLATIISTCDGGSSNSPRPDMSEGEVALLQSSLGAANVTMGDEEYSTDARIRPGDVVAVQLWVMNAETTRAIEDVRVRAEIREQGEVSPYLYVEITAPGVYRRVETLSFESLVPVRLREVSGKPNIRTEDATDVPLDRRWVDYADGVLVGGISDEPEEDELTVWTQFHVEAVE